MMKLKLTTITAVFTVLAVALCGCTTYDNFKQAFIEDTNDTSDVINIGVYEPMTGTDKDAAQPEIDGIELAHELHPRIGGRDVNLIYADNNSNIDAAYTAIDTLLEDEPSVILGSYGNVYSLIASEKTEEKKVPTITMTNTNPLVTRNNTYYFRICYRDATQGRLLANYLDSIDVEKVGVLKPTEDDAATEISTAFINAFEEFSGKDDDYRETREFLPGTKDFTEQLDAFVNQDIRYVLLPGDVDDSLRIINQASKKNMDITFLGNMTWGTEDFKKGLASTVDPKHLAFVQFFAADGDDQLDEVSETRQEFLDAYHAKHGDSTEPEEAVALGYDAYMIAIDAIEKATAGADKTADGEAVCNLMLSDDYRFEGASGTIQFNKSGDPKKTAYISTWDQDAVKAIYTIETQDQ